MLKQFKTTFYNISKQDFLRPNFGYRYFFDVKKSSIWEKEKTILLKYVLKEIETKKVVKWELEDTEILIDIWNIERRQNNLINLEKVEEIWSDKNIIQDWDIVIPKLQPQMWNIFLNLEHNRYLWSTELLEYNLIEWNNPTYIYYIITHNDFLCDLAKLESWKTHRRVNSNDLLKIKIPNIPLPNQNQIVSKIEPIEQKIKELKATIKDQKDIINEVFARDFWFDENLVNEFGKWMTALTQSLQDRKLKINTIKLDELVKSKILRVSTRFHNEPTKKLMEFLETLKTIEIKDIISESVHRWASPSYDENWEIPVIKTWHLKNWYIEITREEFVNQEFYDKNIRSQVKFWDVLIASTWKWSLWKIDIVENDEIDLVCDSHVSIIRVNEEKYNSLFLTYFLRSIIGIFQVERDYTWATNQIELYACEIENFKIPDISLPDQQKIVNEIKLELDKQEKIKKDIEKERIKIDELIEESIKNL